MTLFTATVTTIALLAAARSDAQTLVISRGGSRPVRPTNPGQEQWRVFRGMARLWRDAVNKRGRDVTLVDLPAIGIKGNTHFPMSDLNNVEVANHLAEYLHRKGLDSKRQ